MTEAKTPLILLLHDGELPDIEALLTTLGLGFCQRRGAPRQEDREQDWDVVVATPRRLLDLQVSPELSQATLIAIIDQDSRTLRNSLKRAGIRKMVRRPVHPGALRALLLHSLYRGPEKRSSPRVSVGAPVRLRTGWRARPAVLTDLSLGGCRVLSGNPIERGHSFSLCVPASLSGGRAFKVKARALEVVRDPDSRRLQRMVTARFENLSSRQLTRLEATVQRHASGPASFSTGSAPPPLNAVSDAERRETGRLALDQPVSSNLDDEAARVLMGHDLSVGGMRVQPNPHLVVGMDLKLSVHVQGRETPLTLNARVDRDDGEAGMLLRFFELPADTTRYLSELMDQLPFLVGEDESGDALVTEIISMGGVGAVPEPLAG